MQTYALSATITQAANFIKRHGFLLAMGLFFYPLLGAAESGSVVGEVFDAKTKQSLPGARVSIEGSDTVVSTDSEGRFRLNGIPAGSRTVTVSYLGASPTSETVLVTAGQTKELSVGLGRDTVQLEAFVVSSFAGPQVQALNEQRQSDRISNIVSADSVGNMPDSDMRAALNRLPGVNITGEEGQVSIRGAQGKLNAVVMDGVSMSQAGARLPGLGDSGTTRAFDMQNIPSESAQSIEVIKSLTPDLDATAVGGIVNIRTGSALNSRQRILSVSPTYFWWDNGGNGEQLQVFYRDILNSKRTLGALVNMSYKRYDRVYYQNEYRHSNEPAAVNGDLPLLSANDVRRNEEDVRQFMFTAAIDYKLSDTTRLSLKPYYNWRIKDEYRKRVDVQLDNVTLTDAEGLRGSGVGARVAKTNRFRPDRELDQSKISLSGETRLLNSTLDYIVSYAGSSFYADDYESTYQYPADTATRNRLAWTYDRSDWYFPVFSIRTQGVPGVPDGTDVFLDNARYQWGDLILRTEDSGDTNIEAKVDWTVRLGTERPLTLKTGGKWRGQKFERRSTNVRYTGVGGVLVPAAMATFEPFSSFNGRYTHYGVIQQMENMVNHFKSNPAAFTYTQLTAINSSANNQYINDENTWAGYMMGTLDVTRKLRVVGGVRAEQFYGDYTWAPTLLPARLRGNFNFSDVTRSTSYIDWFPSASMVYRFDERKVLRLGYSTSIARPDHDDLVPKDNRLLQSFVDPDSLAAGNWTVGNPELTTAKSSNLDLSFEWYYGKSNFFSASIFRKEIDNFIFRATHATNIPVVDRFGVPTLAGGAPVYVVVTRPENGGKQEIEGYEISWQHRFGGLPGALSGLGAGVNYSNIKGVQDRQQYTDRTNPFLITSYVRDPRTLAQPKQILSSQVYWEKYGFEIRGSYTWTDKQVFIFDDQGPSDRVRAPLSFVDASLGYNFRKGWKVFLTVRNLTDEYEDLRYMDNERFLRNYDHDGRSWTLGLRAAF